MECEVVCGTGTLDFLRILWNIIVDYNTWKTLFVHMMDTGEHKILVMNILSVTEAKWVWHCKHEECLTGKKSYKKCGFVTSF